jgi:hypothetical protein
VTPIAYYLLAEPETAFFLGMCIVLGLVSSGLSFGFYAILQHRSLIYFGSTILLFHTILGLLNHDPRHIFDLWADPTLLRLIHLLALLCCYFYYKLIRSSFVPFPNFNLLPSSLFFWLLIVALGARTGALLTLHELWIRLASLTAATMFAATILYGLFFRPLTKAGQWIRLGCLTSTPVMIYPLMRFGFFNSLENILWLPFLLIAILATFSTIWLIGLVRMAKESLLEAEEQSLRNLAITAMEVRDLMNTPLQILEISLNVLRKEMGEDHSVLRRMNKAITSICHINAKLSRYDNSFFWGKGETDSASSRCAHQVKESNKYE